jgi:hypothetical protein
MILNEDAYIWENITWDQQQIQIQIGLHSRNGAENKNEVTSRNGLKCEEYTTNII